MRKFFQCRDEQEYRSRVSMTIQTVGFPVWSLMTGEEANFCYPREVVDRFNMAIAELSMMVNEARVMPAPQAAEKDPGFQRFMGAALGRAAGEKGAA